MIDRLYAKAGDEVVCTNGHRICTVACRIAVGDLYKDDQLTDWTQPAPALGDIPKPCVLCGAPWWSGDGMRLHFKDGWR